MNVLRIYRLDKPDTIIIPLIGFSNYTLIYGLKLAVAASKYLVLKNVTILKETHYDIEIQYNNESIIGIDIEDSDGEVNTLGCPQT